MMKLLGILFCLFTILSCNSKSKDIPEARFDVDVESAEKLHFNTMFADVSYIPLETSLGNEIGMINRILYHDDKFVIKDQQTNSVFIFDKRGKFISKIEAIGNGPGEYAQLGDVAIDQVANNLLVLDGMQNKIIVFDFKGKFIRESKITQSSPPMYFCQINHEKYAFDFLRRFSKSKDQYQLYIGTHALSTITDKYIPYQKPLGVVFSPRVTLQRLQDELIYIPLYSPTIYTIDESGVAPRYTFDFGGKWIDEDFINKDWRNPITFMEELKKGDFITYFNLLESDSHIYAEFQYKEDKYRMNINKVTSEQFILCDKDPQACYNFDMPMCNIGDRFVMPITAATYNSSYRGNSPEVSEESNPILVSILFK